MELVSSPSYQASMLGGRELNVLHNARTDAAAKLTPWCGRRWSSDFLVVMYGAMSAGSKRCGPPLKSSIQLRFASGYCRWNSFR